MQRFESVDAYIEAHPEWEDELNGLRTILTAMELDETVKWGAPAYQHRGKTIIGIGAFKQFVALTGIDAVNTADKRASLVTPLVRGRFPLKYSEISFIRMAAWYLSSSQDFSLFSSISLS